MTFESKVNVVTVPVVVRDKAGKPVDSLGKEDFRLFDKGKQQTISKFTPATQATEMHYVLGFSPQNLKLDGSYHNLKVTLKDAAGLSIEARSGYYAPRRLSDADEEAKAEISRAMFSRDEMHEIPVGMHTQFFRAGPQDARLSVINRIDVRKLHYRKADGRNQDQGLVVSGLFDHNGNFLQAVAKTIKLRLTDETLADKLGSGVTLRADFQIVPGRYLLRLVVRDAEGQMMAAHNGAVEIP